MLKIYKILYIFIIFNLYCAEYSLPKEILTNVAEFMPANSKFVNCMARVSMFSSKKYYDIAKSLICKTIDMEKDLEERYQHIQILYDYEDITDLLNKYFKTVPKDLYSIDNNFLREKMHVAFTLLLQKYPEIAFISNLYKLDKQKLDAIIEKELKGILFIRRSLERNSLSLSNKLNREIELIHKNLDQEHNFLIICHYELKRLSSIKSRIKLVYYTISNRGILFTLLPYPIFLVIWLFFMISVLPSLFIPAEVMFGIIIFLMIYDNIIDKTIGSETIEFLLSNLLENFENDKQIFDDLYRQLNHN